MRPCAVLALAVLAACGSDPEDTDAPEETGGPAETGLTETGGPTDTGSIDTAGPTDTGPTDTGAPIDLAAELSEHEGCADVTMYARRPDDSLALVFTTSGAAEAAHAAGAPTTFTWALPDPAVSLELREGSYVTHTTCNDSVYQTTEIDGTWTATAGQVELQVTPTSPPQYPYAYPADGVLILTDVVLEPAGGGPSLTLPSLTISAAIGWLPG